MPTRGEIAAEFEAIADEFDASRPRPWPETFAFEGRLPRRARVLDLGCGGGRNLLFLRERGLAAVGLDSSARLLALSAAKGLRPHVVRGDVVSLPFRTAAFDGVLCVAVIHHLPTEEERLHSLREAVRVLRPGGLFLVGAWALEQDRFRDVYDEALRTGDPKVADISVPWRRKDGSAVERFYHLFHASELERLVRAAGLVVERAWREGDNHVVLARR